MMPEELDGEMSKELYEKFLEDPDAEFWTHHFIKTGGWIFENIIDNNWRKVLDSLLYKRSVFIITLPTSIPGEIEHYKKKLEALGYDVEITTKKLLKEFIHDMRDQLDPIYYMGIDSYLNKFMMAWEEK